MFPTPAGDTFNAFHMPCAASLVMRRVLTVFDLDKDVNLYMTKEILKMEEMNMKTYKRMEDFAEFWEMG